MIPLQQSLCFPGMVSTRPSPCLSMCMCQFADVGVVALRLEQGSKKGGGGYKGKQWDKPRGAEAPCP